MDPRYTSTHMNVRSTPTYTPSLWSSHSPFVRSSYLWILFPKLLRTNVGKGGEKSYDKGLLPDSFHKKRWPRKLRKLFQGTRHERRRGARSFGAEEFSGILLIFSNEIRYTQPLSIDLGGKFGRAAHRELRRVFHLLIDNQRDLKQVSIVQVAVNWSYYKIMHNISKTKLKKKSLVWQAMSREERLSVALFGVQIDTEHELGRALPHVVAIVNDKHNSMMNPASESSFLSAWLFGCRVWPPTFFWICAHTAYLFTVVQQPSIHTTWYVRRSGRDW